MNFEHTFSQLPPQVQYRAGLHKFGFPVTNVGVSDETVTAVANANLMFNRGAINEQELTEKVSGILDREFNQWKYC